MPCCAFLDGFEFMPMSGQTFNPQAGLSEAMSNTTVHEISPMPGFAAPTANLRFPGARGILD
jgi:phenylalanine-4-hydroxylase